MRHYTWLLFLQGLLCYHSPLSINPDYQTAWNGSCLLIRCQISEMHYSDQVSAREVAWYFKPHWNQSVHDISGSLLYDSSQTSEEHMNLTSPAFQGRVRFVGDLSKRDCSLVITQLQAQDKGTYGARVIASVGSYSWRQMLFDKTTIEIRESPPEPKIEIIHMKTQGGWTMVVNCSVPYHCPNMQMTLTLRGLEKHYLSPQKTTIEGGMIQTMVNLEPTWEEHRKTMSCLLSKEDGSQLSESTVVLDVKHGPVDVQIQILNDLPIKEGDTVTLNCSVGSSFPEENWFNWLKSDSHISELTYSGSKLLTFPAQLGPDTAYKCEACNVNSCTTSPEVILDVHFAPKEVKISQEPTGPIQEGTYVKLRCEVGRPVPQNITYTWYHNEKQLQLDSADEVLIISEVDLRHSGHYWCNVSNSVGKLRSSAIMLHVICFLCNESPLSVSPNTLNAWRGSCVLFPCQITEMSFSGAVHTTSLAWYFEPHFDNVWHGYYGRLLYDSSKTSEEHKSLASSAFRDRVKFVGNVSGGDCSLMISRLQIKDSGFYGIQIVASVRNYPWRLKRFLSVEVNIKGSPPKPEMEIIPEKLLEHRRAEVICWVPYDCVDEAVTLTISNLEGNWLPSQNTTIGHRVLRTVLSFEPTKVDHGKKLRCSLSGEGWTRTTHNIVELDVKYAPNEVKISILNDLPIKEGDTVMLQCNVDISNPEDHWYNWLKSDSHTVDMAYSASKSLTFLASHEPGTSYKCEACNDIGCTSSSAVTLDVHFAPKEVKILQEPKGRIQEGTHVELRCKESMANPGNISYTWFHDGEQLQLSSASERLVIPFVLSAQSGSYWCEASNSVGTSRSSAITLDVFCTRCTETPLSMGFSSLTAWEGSCVLIPCHFSETYNLNTIHVDAVVWYFEPSGENVQTKVLYDSSKSLESLKMLTRPDFRGRVRFLGNLSNRDCSLMVTQLQAKNSGTYGASVLASMENQPWRLKWFLSAMVNITGSPPKPKMEIIPAELQERRRVKVICSVPYHCPDESITLTIGGLEGNELSSQATTFENRKIQTMASFDLTWRDNGKVLRCLLRSQDGSQKSQSTRKLDIKFAPKEVIAVQEPDEEMVVFGQPLKLRCKAGRANPQIFTYVWFKDGEQLTLDSASDLLTIQEVRLEDVAAYHCEVSNNVGTSRSSQVELEASCESPSNGLGLCYILARTS
ncbi:B-cell receptor CD22-like [Elgaria multicarinata webbii]|uniref:B-cell receptor CD22-like n=1 Tax=Elgaria multicarinata webbii TaxID=159646 RepID=UPI002FCCF83E